MFEKEKINTIDPILESLENKLNLKQQWESQVKSLNQTGVIEILPKAKDIGIVDINGKEQPIPKYEDIIEELKTNKEKLELIKTKTEQYENPKLLLVPLGMPIAVLIDRYKRLLLKKHEQGELTSTNGDKLELDKDKSIYVEDTFKDPDTDNKLIYFPEQFDKTNHKGTTKQELINKQGAWQTLIIEDIDIPAENKGKTIKQRKQLEANDSPENYLKTIQEQEQYKHEQPPTIESELTYAITKLQQTNQQIDDYQGTGKICWLNGNYLPEQGDSGGVPCFRWFRVCRRADLYWNLPSHRIDNNGSRLGVRI